MRCLHVRILLFSQLTSYALETQAYFHKRNHFDVHETSIFNVEHPSSLIPSCFIFQKDLPPSSPRRLLMRISWAVPASWAHGLPTPSTGQDLSCKHRRRSLCIGDGQGRENLWVSVNDLAVPYILFTRSDVVQQDNIPTDKYSLLYRDESLPLQFSLPSICDLERVLASIEYIIHPAIPLYLLSSQLDHDALPPR
ncbi:hypothetical protein BDR06DRAFT_224846 [Suillus hirtellus]|nr:hypothetical protein BDR06DRAFT_224846 [Suillus hirtellus]